MGRRFGTVSACMALLLLLTANAVPTSDQDLLQNADLVVDLTVDKLDASTPLPNGGTMDCFEGVVSRWIKGTSDPTIKVCPSFVSEFTPPPPKRDGHYRMYLRASKFGYYWAFSYAGFKPIKE